MLCEKGQAGLGREKQVGAIGSCLQKSQKYVSVGKLEIREQPDHPALGGGFVITATYDQQRIIAH